MIIQKVSLLEKSSIDFLILSYRACTAVDGVAAGNARSGFTVSPQPHPNPQLLSDYLEVTTHCSVN
ncbi:MAG: hypothetical protein E6905_08910, partial [Actinomyces sp.]|nr:hypothetical protein [Actinomyces sp.]